MVLSAKLRHIALSLLCLVAVALQAQINTDQVMNIGRNALYFEDYVLSIQYFNQVIKAKPYLAEPYFFRSVAKIDLEDYKGAEEDATMCIERNPFINDAYRLRGAARQNQHKFRQAVDDYEAGLNQNPDDKMMLMNKGVCLLQLEDYEAADSVFAQVRKVDAKNEKVFLAMAQMNLAQNDTAKALANIEKSLEINRANEMAYAMRADIFRRHETDYHKAIADIDSLITFQPRNAGHFINRAYLKYVTDDYFGAMSDYDYAIGLEPNNTMAIYNRGQLSAEVGESRKAIADFSKVLKQEPDNFLALYNRAQLYLITQQYRKAIADYDRILKKYPRFESGYMTRAEAKQRVGDLKGSERDMSTAIAIFKQKGIRVATYDPVKGELQKAEKKYQQEAKAAGEKMKQPETEDEIISKFNSLLTVASDNEIKPEYDNHSRGHIQNNVIDINPEPMFHLSYYSQVNKLNGRTFYMREVSDVNESKLLPMMLVVTNDDVQLDEENIGKRFASIEYYDGLLATATPRAIDYFARAVDFMMVKNTDAAINDVERALNITPRFALAHFLRADAHYLQYLMEKKNAGVETTTHPANDNDAQAAAMLRLRNGGNARLNEVIADLDSVLAMSPKNIYAVYNKGVAYLQMNNYTAAINCFAQAIELKPDLGEAYYNRGLMYLKLGNKEKGEADLSKAGELGILPSYGVLKRMNNLSVNK